MGRKRIPRKDHKNPVTRVHGPAAPPVPVAPPAVMYSRVSSKDQEKEGFSIPAQQKLLRSYATDKGYRVVEEFTDVETAKRAGRASFGKMVAWLKAHPECRVVLVEKTDRLYRNLSDYVQLEGMNLEIHLVKEAVILSDDSRSHEKFIHGIKVLMAKNYVDNLSEEVRKGLREKADQGIWPGPAPFGYINVSRPDGKRIIDVDPERGPHARRMFELYATGRYSINDLVKYANENQLVSWKSKRPLHTSAIHLILRNPLYKGEYRWLGTWHQGSHPRLVTPELWEKVQELCEERGSSAPAPQKHQFAFCGLVYCGACGDEGNKRMLVGELQRGKYIYYHCDGCKRAGRKPKYIREEALGRLFTQALEGLRLEGPVHDWLTGALKSSHEDERRFHTEAMARLQKRYAQLKGRLDILYEDRLDGRITLDDYTAKSNGWREEMAHVREEMDQHERADAAYVDAGVALLELAKMAVELYESQPAPEKRQLLDFFCSNTEFCGDYVRVGWRKPYDSLAKAARAKKEKGVVFREESDAFLEWRSGRDSNPRPPA